MAIESATAETLFAAISTSFAAIYEIAFPSVDFTPSSPTAVYLDVSWLPNGAAWEAVGSDPVTHQGILQIAVMYPSSPSPGAIAPATVAATVADTFDKGTRFFGTGCVVTIPTRPVIAQPFPSDGYVRVPVTISYQSETAT